MKISVFLIHGIGKNIGSNYYDSFVLGIRKYLPVDADINFHPVEYSHLLEEKENTIYSWLREMGYQGLRKFACDFVCDVLAYAYPWRPAGPGDFIFDVTELIKGKFKEVSEKYPDNKKVVIGHSLGSIVGYGFTWIEPVDCLITMGSPFDYFSIRYKGFGEMNPTLKRFCNFWKSYDLVSTIISENPNFRTVKDIQVKTFNPKFFLPIKAHTTGYWDSDFVQREIAKILKEL